MAKTFEDEKSDLSFGFGKVPVVSGRKVTGFSSEAGQGNRNRAYAEPGVGRSAGSVRVS